MEGKKSIVILVRKRKTEGRWLGVVMKRLLI